jgi:hypothetical protein
MRAAFTSVVDECTEEETCYWCTRSEENAVVFNSGAGLVGDKSD